MNIQWQDSETITINNITTSAIIEDSSDVLNYFADKYIITKYQVKTGDLVEYAGITYIVVSQIDRNYEKRKESQYNYRARVRQADFTIKIVLDGVVQTIPTIIGGETFSILRGELFSTDADKITVTMQENSITNNIIKGMRFIKLNGAWKIVGIDKTKLGLVNLFCDSDMFEQYDDKENEVANADLIEGSEPVEPGEPGEPIDPEIPLEDNFTIEIDGKDRFGLMTETSYNTRVLNNGIEVEDKQVTFSLSNTLAIIKSQGDNSCTLETNRQFKTGTFTLTATLVDDETIFTERTIIITGL